MSDFEKFGERLKDLRLQRDLTMDMVVNDMSREFTIELTKGNLSRWENGVNYPSLRLAAYLAAYYKVSLDYLIGSTDIKAPVDLLASTKRLKAQKKED